MRLDLLTAHAVIRATQDLGEAWGRFLDEAPRAVLHARYQPPLLPAMRHEIVHKILALGEGGLNCHLAEEVENICDFAAIYSQRNEIKLPQCAAQILFWRLPTEEEFDRARMAMLFALEFFRMAETGLPCSEWRDRGITLTVRGQERIFDLHMDNIGVNDRALVGFDFTDLDN